MAFTPEDATDLVLAARQYNWVLTFASEYGPDLDGRSAVENRRDNLAGLLLRHCGALLDLADAEPPGQRWLAPAVVAALRLYLPVPSEWKAARELGALLFGHRVDLLAPIWPDEPRPK